MEVIPELRPKVLIVTYLDVMAETWVTILGRYGFDAFAVRTAEEMLEKAPELRPDVIVSEILLDGMNGVEAAIRISAVLPSVKFLMFSGQARAADLLEVAQQRGYQFEALALPIHPNDLITKLRELVDPLNPQGKLPVRINEVDSNRSDEFSSPARVLFVTYLDTVAEMMIKILSQAGFEGSTVRTGEEMLEKAPGFRPDAIVCEILLEGMTGVDAAIRLREVLPSVKFLMFSGGRQAADVLQNALERGYEFEVIGLPFHPQDLMNRLCQLVGRTPVDLKMIRFDKAEVSTSRRVWNYVTTFFRF